MGDCGSAHCMAVAFLLFVSRIRMGRSYMGGHGPSSVLLVNACSFRYSVSLFTLFGLPRKRFAGFSFHFYTQRFRSPRLRFLVKQGQTRVSLFIIRETGGNLFGKVVFLAGKSYKIERQKQCYYCTGYQTDWVLHFQMAGIQMTLVRRLPW